MGVKGQTSLLVLPKEEAGRPSQLLAVKKTKYVCIGNSGVLAKTEDTSEVHPRIANHGRVSSSRVGEQITMYRNT